MRGCLNFFGQVSTTLLTRQAVHFFLLSPTRPPTFHCGCEYSNKSVQVFESRIVLTCSNVQLSVVNVSGADVIEKASGLAWLGSCLKSKCVRLRPPIIVPGMAFAFDL